jgi:hypothetical protein
MPKDTRKSSWGTSRRICGWEGIESIRQKGETQKTHTECLFSIDDGVYATSYIAQADAPASAMVKKVKTTSTYVDNIDSKISE